jgi:hypothetical protein
VTSIALPERLGRRMSLGPFEDPRELLRFLLFASVGALFALRFGIVWWVPFVAAGALLTLGRSQEDSWGDLALRRVRYYLRPRRPGVPPPPLPKLGPHDHADLERSTDLAGRAWELWERVPSSLSGRDADELFREARELLRALVAEGRTEALVVRAGVSWDVRCFLPRTPSDEGREGELRRGYSTLLQTSVEGLRRPRLLLALPGADPTTRPRCGDDDGRLESLGWRRLRGPELRRVLGDVFPMAANVRGRLG